MHKKFLLLIFFLFIYRFNIKKIKAQKFNIISGRPTDSVVIASMAFEQNVEYYIDYRKQSANHSSIPYTHTNMASIPDELDIGQLLPNVRYYYILRYRLIGATSYEPHLSDS